jgi:hypothetical protein
MMCFFLKSLLLQCTCGGKDNKAYTQAIVSNLIEVVTEAGLTNLI